LVAAALGLDVGEEGVEGGEVAVDALEQASGDSV